MNRLPRVQPPEICSGTDIKQTRQVLVLVQFNTDEECPTVVSLLLSLSSIISSHLFYLIASFTISLISPPLYILPFCQANFIPSSIIFYPLFGACSHRCRNLLQQNSLRTATEKAQYLAPTVEFILMTQLKEYLRMHFNLRASR